MQRKLTFLAPLLVAVVLAACGSPVNDGVRAPQPEFGSVEQVYPVFDPFHRDTGGAPLAEVPSVWFVEVDAPAVVDGGSIGALSNAYASVFGAAAEAGIDFDVRYTFSTFVSGFSVEIEPFQLLALSSLPGVRSVSPVGIIEPPEVTRHGLDEVVPHLTTALAMTGADVVQSELGFDGSGIRVGIIDTGLVLDHPEFAGRIFTGFDFVGDFYNAGDPLNNVPVPEPGPGTRPGGGDCNGHGTHVAGIVGAGGVEVTGVAPGVEFGAYRVFGCAGSSHSDVILKAIERAFEDGMDVINLSLGSNNGWPQDFLSIALSRVLDLGMVPVASAGNNGESGVYTIGSPGAGADVITVASFDNTFIEQNIFEVEGRTIGYALMTGSLDTPTEGSEEIVYIGRGCPAGVYDGFVLEEDDPFVGDPAGKIALAIRGLCPFASKALRAEAAGATAVVIHNSVPGNFAGTLGGVPVGVPVVSIALADGEFIRQQDDPINFTWLDGTELFPNPTGELISGFSSYGLAPDLTLKPDIGAPGGLIKSSYIANAVAGDPMSGDAIYAVLSGTSMSAPHIAGTVALLLDARPDIHVHQVRDVLQNSAEPQLWFGNPALGFAESVHRQGAGMVRIDNAILAATSVVPGKLSVGESAQGTFREVMYIHNHTDQDITYALGSISSTIATAGTNPPLGFFLSGAMVEFFKLRQSSFYDPISAIEVPAGGVAAFEVRVTANPGLPNGAVYGGYLVFAPQTAVEGVLPIRVPYSGFKGDYQQLPAFTFPPFLAFADDTGVYILPEGWIFTMRDGDVPTFGVGMAHAAQLVKAELVPLGERSWLGAQPGFEIDLLRRNNPGTVYVFGLGSFDATGLPDGSYKIRYTVLKPLGDPTNPAHTVVAETPFFVIDRTATFD